MKSNEDWIKDWNKLHIEYAGNDDRNDKMADYCEKILLEAKEAYYKSEDPIMEDDMYDRFERDLKCLRPDSKVLKQVGSK